MYQDNLTLNSKIKDYEANMDQRACHPSSLMFVALIEILKLILCFDHAKLEELESRMRSKRQSGRDGVKVKDKKENGIHNEMLNLQRYKVIINLVMENT
jgi:hypothetical protein